MKTTLDRLRLLFLLFVSSTDSYLLLVNENQQPGDVIFDTSVYKLGVERTYQINTHRTAEFVASLLTVDAKDGRVSLLESLHCDGLFYPNLFTVYVDSISKRLREVDYYSIPLRILIVGVDCDDNAVESRRKRSIRNIVDARQWVSETYATFSIPSSTKICLRKSQLVNSLTDFIPKTVANFCQVDYVSISDDRFSVEKSQGDLVAGRDVCVPEPLWKVVVFSNVRCRGAGLLDADHRLKIVYHYELFNDTDIARRVRRELRNQSPFFEQHLYVASVLEECEAGLSVTTMKARDPENAPVTYSMTSLLDARTQSMFEIDAKSGEITTKVKLDRELLDVHYFKVMATDDSFPPRSGTTMLQINVLDANDHSPVFELAEYDANVREGVSVGTTVLTLKAADQDVGKNSEVEYSIQSVNGGGMSTDDEDKRAFKIDGKTGVISTRTALDREVTEVYTIVIKATDLAMPQNARRTASASVVVKILDDNDNYPQFSERTYTVNVNEDVNWSENPVIAHIKATDADQAANSAIRFAIIGGNTQSQFTIDSLTGDVSLVKPLDYETLRNYRLVIRAQDGGSPARSNTTQLLVNVKDVNDNAPRFYTSLFQESVSESVPAGYSIVKVQAYDADEGANADIKYTIAPRDGIGASTEDLPLAVDSHSGWIYTTRELDREQQPKYMFHVIASDQGVPPQSASASIVISVQDINDNDPIFEPKVYEVVVSEDNPPGTPVATVIASDADEDGRIHYELTSGNIRGRFAITSHSGRGLITVAQPLDYKQEKRYVLTVTASDSGGRTDTATVYVNVSDANNFTPVFENAPYTASVFEDAPIGTTVLVISATDNDVGINAQIKYSLGEDSANTEFAINPQTGAITTTKLLDRETTNGYLLTVTAKDGGNPPLSDTTDVEISVTDVNDNFPVFKQPVYSGNVLEDALVGTSVVQVSATDADIGLNGRIRYALSEKDVEDGSFVIDPTSGVVRTNKGLDRESVAVYELEAYAIDRGSPSLSSSVPVNIRIEDINDSPPAFETDKIVLYIAENSPIGSTVGELYAKDPDEGVNAIVQYSIIGGDDSASFSLITRPGSEKAELLTMTELDYESPRKRYELVVRAASPPLRSDAHVEIIVTDVNDNAPVLKDFQILFNNFRDYFPTGPVGRVPAFDADVSDKLRYKILSGNNANLVALNETTGMLQLSPQLNTNVPKVASMEVSVTDGVNDVKAIMQLNVRLITEEMLFNSITVRLNQMTKEAFLSPLLTFFLDGLAAIIPCPRENIFIFSVQDDTDVNANILNVSFSARRPDTPKEEYYTPQYLQERVYLNRVVLDRLSTVKVLPFDDNLCVREPCLNFEECLTVLKFGNASNFISSDTVLFRPIYPVTTFTCRCPKGFTGAREHYLCDTEVNLCYSNPCQNYGTCKIREGGYTCVCPPDFTGVNCDIKLNTDVCKTNICRSGSTCIPKTNGGYECNDCLAIAGSEHYTPLCELKSRSFSKGSFLTFPSLKQRHRLHLQLRFATQSPDGLLLYNGRYNEQHDFVALEIIGKNVVQFSFSLGGSVTRAFATVPGGVSDGRWHLVTVTYFNKTATVSLDNCDVSLALKRGRELGGKWACAGYATHELEARCASLTETCHRFLDLTGPLQLGGLPAIPAVFQPKNHHFDGCISEFYVDYKFIDLNTYVTDNGTTPGCPEKRPFCNSKPCRNGGECRDGWNMYQCTCTDGYGGRDCSELISQPWRFSGDGSLSFNPLLRPIQLPWLNALSVRTLQPDTFLMSIQVGQNSSVVISLKSGIINYMFNEAALNLTSKTLSDGEWHRIEITWIGTEIKLSVDFGESSATIPFSAKIQGLFVGKILIGGLDNSYTSLSAGFDYLEGCVQDVRVGNHQTALTRPTVRENVADGCQSLLDCQSDCPSSAECVIEWGSSYCECRHGHVGALCQPVCSSNPCENHAQCIESSAAVKGYDCKCNSSEYSGEYCEDRLLQPCPASWWGYPVCGPCDCDTEAGYNPDCNKATGQCFCRENHYQPSGTSKCLACDCYTMGSLNSQCNHETGQCRCKEGVIGLRCDSCPNPFAEITLRGCEVIYDGCPRSSAQSIWWTRTNFGSVSLENCPKGSVGKASRLCDNQLGGWQLPDMFNCTSERFVELRNQLSQLEKGELILNSFVAIKLALDLRRATNFTYNLYGADVLVTYDLLDELLKHESTMNGLNLTHSQDKDYVRNLVNAASTILDAKYLHHWSRIKELTGKGAENLVALMESYINVLTSSQHDTYTNPFEIVASNLVLGLDIITPESLYGYETNTPTLHLDVAERVIIPDTSQFLQHHKQGPTVSFPKYNNYIKDDSKFDVTSKIFVPLSLLGINPPENVDFKHALSESKAVLSYAQYKQAAHLFQDVFDESVVRRWGVDIIVGSPLMSVSVLVPEYVEPIVKKTPVKVAFEEFKAKSDAVFYRMKRDQSSTRKLLYRSLAGIQLKVPVKLQMWLDSNATIFNERSNPQCVHWTTKRGRGEWSRIGCRTETTPNWFDSDNFLVVNCTCNRLATFAVLVDVVDLEYIPEPSLLEDISSYSCFVISLPLLLGTYLILALIRGLQTNSNTVRKNLVLCVFLAELLYFVSMKARRPLVANEVACKLMAIAQHYLWLAGFSWMLVDALHLYRMLTEMRDINHGPMRFYYCVGYALPAVIVSLSVGVRAHQYGNYYFCWVSLYESVIWSLVGPICVLVLLNLLILVFSIRAAFTLQDHVLGFGNLRTLLWVSVVSLPLLGATWVLALLAASERYPLLTPLLSLAVLGHGIFALGGYCFANQRVRQNLTRSVMRCMGKKVPLLETNSIGGAGGATSNSSHNITVPSRSTMAFRGSGFETNRRNIGISASSTTSRSTTKTGSSPYRSDTQLRQTSTSTSNYNSTSDVPSYLHGFDTTDPSNLQRHKIAEEAEGRRDRRQHARGESDSDSDGSEGRSLDLASSHSSDDDESSSRRHHHNRTKNTGVSTLRQGYLPNITEHVSRCGSPPALNIVTNSQLFPAIQPMYATRWSSQLPEAYLHTNVPEIGRWSADTGSDNEFAHKTASPNPLPNPDVTPDTCMPQQFVGRMAYDSRFNLNDSLKNYGCKNYQDYAERCSDIENDKYLFPYTAEEDHLHNYTQQGRTNDVNNPGSRMGSRIGSVLGSVHGSVCGSLRGSPTTLSMLHNVVEPPQTWCWDYPTNK